MAARDHEFEDNPGYTNATQDMMDVVTSQLSPAQQGTLKHLYANNPIPVVPSRSTKEDAGQFETWLTNLGWDKNSARVQNLSVDDQRVIKDVLRRAENSVQTMFVVKIGGPKYFAHPLAKFTMNSDLSIDYAKYASMLAVTIMQSKLANALQQLINAALLWENDHMAHMYELPEESWDTTTRSIDIPLTLVVQEYKFDDLMDDLGIIKDEKRVSISVFKTSGDVPENTNTMKVCIQLGKMINSMQQLTTKFHIRDYDIQ